MPVKRAPPNCLPTSWKKVSKKNFQSCPSLSKPGKNSPPTNADAVDTHNQCPHESSTSSSSSDLEYTVFGLGNQQAHPNYYNVIAKGLDQRLEELGARRVQRLGLGDDGDCIEDDFDHWMDEFLGLLKKRHDTGGEPTAVAADIDKEEIDDSPAEAILEEDVLLQETTTNQADTAPRISCPGATTPDGTRRISKKYPTLLLSQPESDVCRDDLFHLQGTKAEFYKSNTAKLHVLSNKILSPNAGEQALNEMRVSLQDFSLDNGTDDSLGYRTGDHLVVYPRNSQCIVEAYLNHVLEEVDPHAIIVKVKGSGGGGRESDGGDDDSYPYPRGLTVYETLSHCIDLGALPPPALARQILGRKKLEYKAEIANPRRTVIDLMLEHNNGNKLSLEDLFYRMVPMKPRYYSIASSNIATPDEIRLTFRQAKYMTSRGVMREGVATSFMTRKGVGGGADTTADDDDYSNCGHLPAYVHSNPTFRLPEDPKVPIMMIAGGCGVAPIRAFVDERIALQEPNKLGPGSLYLGFRNPSDAVYQSLIDKAMECGALTEAKVCFDHGCSKPNQQCMRVSELLRSDGEKVWEHIESGGFTYLCGGARTFGAAIESQLLEIFKEHGNMTLDEGAAYLRKLVESGRLMEDLAD
jgi:NADPH-ferrihemoprotein reductase